ncbi:hypothetical protein B484DRAFT_459082 [Ochromonadaceae sp. CCMP2298]|nr:hypothetical protein B484DRAFT_459082 [Ochromonadaceae sp. CCMP2298]
MPSVTTLQPRALLLTPFLLCTLCLLSAQTDTCLLTRDLHNRFSASLLLCFPASLPPCLPPPYPNNTAPHYTPSYSSFLLLFAVFFPPLRPLRLIFVFLPVICTTASLSRSEAMWAKRVSSV